MTLVTIQDIIDAGLWPKFCKGLSITEDLVNAKLWGPDEPVDFGLMTPELATELVRRMREVAR